MRRPPERRLRVGVYTDSSHLGGAEQGLANLLAGLDGAVEVTVIGSNAEVVDYVAAARPGARAAIVPRVRHKTDVIRFGRLLRAMRHLRLDVLHAHLRTPWASQYGLAAGLLLPRVRIVVVENSPVPASAGLQRIFKRATSARAAGHVAAGRWLAQEVERLASLRPGSIDTIHYGIPDTDITPLPRPFPGPTAGVVARLVPEKGVDVLLRAVAKIDELSLVVVGDGPARPDLEGLVDDLGIGERVLFAGYTDEPRRWLGAVDMFVLPSFMEGMPLSPVEAMLAGLPVVASDVGGIAEAVLEGETGHLVPAGDDAALATAVAELVADPERARAMGRAGRERALDVFGVEQMASAYLALYRRATA